MRSGWVPASGHLFFEVVGQVALSLSLEGEQAMIALQGWSSCSINMHYIQRLATFVTAPKSGAGTGGGGGEEGVT